MYYFIYSPKQTSITSVDQYYRPNSNGYTPILADAGIYNEEEVANITRLNKEWFATPVLLTKELIEKAKTQIEQKAAAYIEYEKQEIARHVEALEYLKKRIEENDKRRDKIANLNELLKSETEMEM